ncbi:MAG: N-acetyltransferase [Betaproteobacteria bacterium]|nr:MAG: N-acetyltransferase [Betaproteobacteria bacterium]
MQITTPPIIHTERLLLRLVRREDLPALFDVNSNPAVTQFLPYPAWQTMDDANVWYERTLTRQETGAAWQFAIVLQQTGLALGTCLLFNFDPSSRRAETGYVLGQAHWSKGYASEAMRGLIAYAFDTLDLRRLEAQINPNNVASCALIERLGFAREGLLRERFFDNGGFCDSAFYGLLRELPPTPM